MFTDVPETPTKSRKLQPLICRSSLRPTKSTDRNDESPSASPLKDLVQLRELQAGALRDAAGRGVKPPRNGKRAGRSVDLVDWSHGQLVVRSRFGAIAIVSSFSWPPVAELFLPSN